MMSTATLRRVLELLSLPSSALAAWFAKDPDFRVVEAGEVHFDARIEHAAEALRVVVTRGPRVEPAPNLDPEHARVATSVIRGLDQRARTLEAVLGALAERQRAYLLGLEPSPRAVSLFTLAAATTLHCHAVRRALANKRVTTPRGPVSPSTWVIDAATLQGRVERVVPHPTPELGAEFVGVRLESGEILVLVSAAPTGWLVGAEVAVDEAQLSVCLRDMELVADLFEAPAGAFSFDNASSPAP